MIVLGLDTCMQSCSAAVLATNGEAGELFRVHEDMERGHAEALMPMIERVMAEAGLGYDELERIAVTTGPGTFTGVRVGVAAARALALATDAKLIGIPSLEVIARQVRDMANGADAAFAVACDARRGQVYFAVYDGEGAILREPAALDARDAAARLPADCRVILAGSGAGMVAGAATGRGIEIAPGNWLPDAGALARMAAGRAPGEGPVDPLYLRPPDAKPQAGKAVERQ